MPPRKTEYIELSGPLFEPDVIDRFHDAVAEGIEDLAEQGEDILTQFVAQAGFIDTGSFISSIGVEVKRSRGAGYATVRPTAVWPNPGRPTRTWLERGTRKGAKLRTANRPFSKTKTRLRQVGVKGFESRIARALN